MKKKYKKETENEKKMRIEAGERQKARNKILDILYESDPKDMYKAIVLEQKNSYKNVDITRTMREQFMALVEQYARVANWWGTL